MASPRIEHVNVTVSDPERAARLMEALFGWRVRWQGPARDGGRTIHVGTADHYVALYTGDGVTYTADDFAKGRPLNHIGVEVDSPADVAAAIQRASADGLEQEIQENVSCCFAVQDKTWVQGPDNAWEFYTVLADAPELACSVTPAGGCESEPVAVGGGAQGSCC